MQHLEQLLGRLEDTWRELGAPIADRLAPGLDPRQIHAHEARHDLTLPDELRRWWGWHDGVRRLVPDTRGGAESLLGAGDWEFLSLAEAFAERDTMLEVAGLADYPPDDSDSDSDGYWRPGWMPVLSCQGTLVHVDCAALRPDGSAPVRVWEAQPTSVTVTRAASWTEAVAFWVRVLDEGHYRWSSRDGRWTMPGRNLPLELVATGLL